ncbi:MarR family transcriptional regulator [Natrinema soli]|uniref:MarR family transcriptional regulator n=1 Tax=Natrinema soli TaxID=1930624 RepID=A0ABD5SZF8_9EURY|nr:MarR family transcriptional regulator [Natrinema soli]
MLKQDTQPTDRYSPLPTELDSAQSKLVYVTLEATGGATTGDLSRLLNMQKLTILSVLSSLSSQGLIEETGSAYVVTN